jgi:hypothetical protein
MIEAGRRLTVSGLSVVVTLATVLALPTAVRAQGPIAGQNVNMVSGTEWPGGDPFLQRQNEPHCAVSTTNPRHLLCGANDYRSVYLPGLPDGEELGDAWLGVFTSSDAAQTWRSTLLHGYPQDPSTQPTPIRGLKAAADPVVRSAPAGVFYYTGIAFNRGSNVGKVFVSRFIDVSDQGAFGVADGDPIQYVDTFEIDSGTSGQFLDKPWSAIGLPAGGTCQIGGRTVPSTPIYFAWARFTGAKSSKIMFSRSLDCGRTWPVQVKLSESNSINQGTTVAVDPVTGYVYVAWRRFGSSSDTDAILIARSTDGGATFPNKDVREIATIAFPFDQNVTETRFRTNALPTMAISVNADGTKSWVHVAWSQRSSLNGDARIALATSGDGVTWPPPRLVDDTAIADDYGATFNRGHQFMPQLAFANGKLMLLYYDQRLDHTIGLLEPNYPFEPDPDIGGRFYREQRVKRGEADGAVFTGLIDEANLSEIRHTLDLRVAQADVAQLDSVQAGNTDPGSALSFVSTRVSEFVFGTRGDEEENESVPMPNGVPVVVGGVVKRLKQLQFNPPNLPLFQQGQLPFIGDYVDLAVLPFVPDASKLGGWAFNVKPSRSPVFYATWTSNQDVRPPATLKEDNVSYDWSAYTPPPFSAESGQPNPIVPAAPQQTCVTGNEGTRNQNIYVSAITQGLSVYSPQNVKRLSTDSVRAFVVTVGNATSEPRAFELRIAGVPSSVGASFRNDAGFGPLNTDGSVNATTAARVLQIEIPARSAIARSVFVQLASGGAADASLRVDVSEVRKPYALTCLEVPSCPLDPGGLTGSVRFNPPGSDALSQPDLAEDYDATVAPTPLNATCDGDNANITSANITSVNCPAANITSANITSANITSSHIANPDLANITSANITSANITSANITSANITSAPLAANITSANITSANITSAPISDATYTLTNTGNTAHSYHVKLVSNTADLPAALQMVVSKTYTTPLGLGCQLVSERHAVVQVNVDDVVSAIQVVGTVDADPNIPDPKTTNATVALAPGESAQITIRGGLNLEDMVELASHISPVVIPHAGDGTTFAAALLVTSDAASLGAFQVGQTTTATLDAVGGSGGYSWYLITASPELNVDVKPGGGLTSTPTAGGSFSFTVGVRDTTTQETAQQTFTVSVATGTSQVLVTAMPPSPYVGESVTFSVTVSPVLPAPSPTVDLPVPTGTVTYNGETKQLDGGSTSFSRTFSASGSPNPLFQYSGDANYTASSGTIDGFQVLTPGATTTTVTSNFNPSVFGQSVTFTATVGSSGAAGTPAGTVAFKDGATSLGSVALDATGKASIATAGLSVGPHSITAAYTSASPAFTGSSSEVFSQSVNKAGTTTGLASSRNPSVYGEAVTFTATVAAFAPGAGLATGTVSFSDGGTLLGTSGLVGGKAAYTTTTTSPLASGTHPITATYNGDGNFFASSAALSQVVGALYRFVGFGTPLATTGETLSISGSWTFTRVLPVKWQLYDNRTNATVTKLTAVKKLSAVLGTTGVNGGCPVATGTGYRTFILYEPTSGAAGGSTFRSSSTGYTFNWDATRSRDTANVLATPGCYWLSLELEDGTRRVTQVKLN